MFELSDAELRFIRERAYSRAPGDFKRGMEALKEIFRREKIKPRAEA